MQELVETVLYSMDRQKDGYIRKEDLVTGLRSSTSFSLSMYREEFILVGLMVAGFLLYQVQIFCFWIPIKHMTFQVAKQYGLVPVIGVYDGPIGTWSVNPSKQSEMHNNIFQTVPEGISDSSGEKQTSNKCYNMIFQEILFNQGTVWTRNQREIYIWQHQIQNMGEYVFLTGQSQSNDTCTLCSSWGCCSASGGRKDKAQKSLKKSRLRWGGGAQDASFYS